MRHFPKILLYPPLIKRNLNLLFLRRLGGIFVLLLFSYALAHSLDMNRATLQLEEAKVFLILTPPSTFFSAFDDDSNGLISVAEVAAHREAINAFLDEGLTLSNEAQTPGELYFYDVLAPGAFDLGSTGESDHLQVSRRYRWDAAPKQVTLRANLLKGSGLALATTFYKDEEAVSTVLSSVQPSYTFSQSAVSRFWTFLMLGLEHVLTGFDHLLFLLALLLVGGGLGYLLKVVTAFTVAHSLTLVLAVMDVIDLPPGLVEGTIALSIAFVAVENLWRGEKSRRWRWLVVFAFGLLHGAGFAGALQDLNLELPGRFLSLLGFNIGVELGQLTFVSVVFTLLALLRNARLELSLRRWSLTMIACAGVFWFVGRVFY